MSFVKRIFRFVKRLYKHYINHNQTLFTLTFPSLSETFVRRSCSVLLAVLATVVMWRGKKSVVLVAQCIAALVLVHRTLSLLADVHLPYRVSGSTLTAVGRSQLLARWPGTHSRILSAIQRAAQTVLRYDTRCCFNVRSKADMSRLNLPHGADN